jgi:hypothetical protein
MKSEKIRRVPAKFTLGALGDRWYGGQTKPWNLLARFIRLPLRAPASATVAGLGPLRQAPGNTGQHRYRQPVPAARRLRPTFGRISRYGTMTLSWVSTRRAALPEHWTYHDVCAALRTDPRVHFPATTLPQIRARPTLKATHRLHSFFDHIPGIAAPNGRC